ncbi:MAG: TetR family transcriptional regulator [Gemmatimonadetes bacterium]|nr:TetR family transcriptional regulator [Gemmatimonadota bacterium]
MYRGSPRRVPDVKRKIPIPLRERILATADDLFRRHGIRGVGVEAIAAEAGTNKVSLYRYFESKDLLITEWVRGIIAQKDAAWDEIVAQHRNDPRAQLVSWSRRTADALVQMEERGSPILNALAELPEEDHPARRLIDEHRRYEHQRILALCRRAGFSESDAVADQFYLLLEGAKSCVQAIGMRRVGEHLMRVVDQMVATKDGSADIGAPHAVRSSPARAPKRVKRGG